MVTAALNTCGSEQQAAAADSGWVRAWVCLLEVVRFSLRISDKVNVHT